MNYYEPRQRKDGRFDYTCMNDGRIWPVGYCHKYIPLSRETGMIFASEETVDEYLKEYEAKQESFLYLYHGDGHATKEEACECYKRYILDHELVLRSSTDDTMKKCEVCGEWTQLMAYLREGRTWHLCDKHNNREEVDKLYPAPHAIWSS